MYTNLKYPCIPRTESQSAAEVIWSVVNVYQKTKLLQTNQKLREYD